jgi:hypothetical protein
MVFDVEVLIEGRDWFWPWQTSLRSIGLELDVLSTKMPTHCVFYGSVENLLCRGTLRFLRLMLIGLQCLSMITHAARIPIDQMLQSFLPKSSYLPRKPKGILYGENPRCHSHL